MHAAETIHISRINLMPVPAGDLSRLQITEKFLHAIDVVFGLSHVKVLFFCLSL